MSNEMNIGVIIEKLDTVFERLEEIKNTSNTRFDKVDQKLEQLSNAVKEQEKVSLKHDIMLRGCRSKIRSIDRTLTDHIEDHSKINQQEAKEKITETKDKTITKIKVGILWAAAVLIASGLIVVFIEALKGFI